MRRSLTKALTGLLPRRVGPRPNRLWSQANAATGLAGLVASAALVLVGCGVGAPEFRASSELTDTTAPGDARQDPAAAYLVSAFFGLDNGLPTPSNVRVCRGAGNADGMPVIFSTEIDLSTMQAGDFAVTTAAGQRGTVTCVTLAPATDQGELRTALLVGEFGSHPSDPPVTVAIVGNLFSLDGALNYNGAEVAVTPLPPGPSIVWAEVAAPADWQSGASEPSWGRGDSCPAATVQAVRAIWAGGITLPDDRDVGEAERQLYTVTIANADGTSEAISPFALGDLGDGDNNHLLCLDRDGAPQAVSFPEGVFVDPNGDLNPETAAPVQP